ncbi:hypothetical protein DVH24_038421 [Malus domestica]|uniref:Uncharacterized protein n=1 Tax=Malus domestica TaxID=3750 RepID=A0A498KA14_MALDO|nr:hypothetical protein DVH24_038421 [Malus domestica]
MTCLSSLKIGQCYALETLPDFLCKIPLQNLSIFVCLKLAEHCKEGSGEEWHKISHIPNIKILNIPSMANRHIIKDIAEGQQSHGGALLRNTVSQQLSAIVNDLIKLFKPESSSSPI